MERSNDNTENRPAFSRIWKKTEDEYLIEHEEIEEVIKRFYPNYTLLPKEVFLQKSQHFATPDFDLGTANYYNLFSSDHLFP